LQSLNRSQDSRTVIYAWHHSTASTIFPYGISRADAPTRAHQLRTTLRYRFPRAHIATLTAAGSPGSINDVHRLGATYLHRERCAANLALLVARMIRGLAGRGRDLAYPIVGLGASAVAGAHACFATSVQNPAVAVTYAALLGIAVAQSWSSRQRTGT